MFQFTVGKMADKKTGNNLDLNNSKMCFSVMPFTIRINIPAVVGVKISLKCVNRCFRMLSALLPTYTLG